MNATQFKALSAPNPQWSRPIVALWYQGQGDWHGAHDALQDDESRVGSWVHAHLHRVEGDAFNAAYWYRRAHQPVPPSTLSLEAEWEQLVEAVTADISS